MKKIVKILLKNLIFIQQKQMNSNKQEWQQLLRIPENMKNLKKANKGYF